MTDPDHSGETPASAGDRACARHGLMLFGIYLVLYAGFMYLSAYRPALMAARPFGGVNLAVWYGMTLIIAPLILAAVYMALCRRSLAASRGATPPAGDAARPGGGNAP